MNFIEAKNNLEIYRKTLENSIKMYETTLNEMIERGADENAVSVVKQMKSDTEQQIRDIDATLENINKTKAKAYLTIQNHVADELLKDFNPLFKNRFIVDFGTDEIKDFYIERVNYGENFLNVLFRDNEEFFTPKYMSKHKHFDTVKIHLLNPLLVTKATIEFHNVRLDTLQPGTLSYKPGEDEMLTTDVIFKFDFVKYD